MEEITEKELEKIMTKNKEKTKKIIQDGGRITRTEIYEKDGMQIEFKELLKEEKETPVAGTTDVCIKKYSFSKNGLKID